MTSSNRSPICADAKEFLDQVRALENDAKPLTLDDLRAVTRLKELRFDVAFTAMHEVRTVLFEARDGALISAHVYLPRALQSGERLPVMLFIHGGGWVMCSTETHAAMCRRLCLLGDVIAVDVEYRLAPEHRFPTGLQDCEDALEWIADNIGELGGDPTRIAVAGDSAGGNLAAVLAQRSAAGVGPRIGAQLLFYPALTFKNRNSFPSWQLYGQGDHLISLEDAEMLTSYYLAAPEDADDIRASPLEADQLTGAPPALIITAECDPLADEGAEYAARLQSAGGQVLFQCFKGQIHSFMSVASVMPVGYEALELAGGFLRGALHGNLSNQEVELGNI